MSLRRSSRNKEPLQGVEPTAGPSQDVENTDPNTTAVKPSDPPATSSSVAGKKKTPIKRKTEPKEKPAPKKRKTVKKADVHEMLEKAGGDLYSDETGNCVRAAIQKGFVKITGRPSDLKKVIHSETGRCGHVIKATLGDLLKQPGYAGTDYEDGLQSATVLCTVDGCAEDEGRTYVTDICTGKPQFDDGKGHNHCTECNQFGKCIGDYRQTHCYQCGKHYFGGFHQSYDCPCQRKAEDLQDLSSQCNQQ